MDHSAMIKKVIQVGVVLFLILGAYLVWLSTTIEFDNRFAHLVFADDGVVDGQVSSDHQWRVLCEGPLPEKVAKTIKIFEDQYFDCHPGFNPVSLAKASIDNFKAGKVVRGGSTITMQLARILEGNPPRTYRQKLKEILLALALEIRFSKGEILKAYAQYAPFGGNTVGYCAASMRYYGKSPDQLSWTEAATLAVLPNDPSHVYPGKGQEVLIRKRNFLLDKLLGIGWIDSVTHRLALLEDLPQQDHSFGSIAPHLLQGLKRQNLKTFNFKTTLDETLQRNVHRILHQYQKEYSSASGVDNLAAVVLRRDGSIAAYVGNVGCSNQCGGAVDILTARRSPGSTLKPFLYALALDQGLISPQSLLQDIPVFYGGYSPANFDKKYRGVVSAQEALTTSLNIPAVNLLKDYGTHAFLSDLRNLGLTSLDYSASHYGLSIILGGSEVVPLELAMAYGNLVRTAYGEQPVSPFCTPEDSVVAPKYFPISSGAAYLTLEMLKGVHRPASEDGWNYFEDQQEIAWKTGTSFGLRDAWSVGCTDQYTVLIWVGNADGEGRPGLTGIDKAAPILFDVFKLLPSQDASTPPLQSSLKVKEVCSASGFAVSTSCEETTFISMPVGATYLPRCSFHKTVSLDTSGHFRAYKHCAQQVRPSKLFVLNPVENHYFKKATGRSFSLPPYLPDCEERLDLDIHYPEQDASILLPTDVNGKKQALVCKVLAAQVDTLYWFLDYSLVETSLGRSEVKVSPAPGTHTLTVVHPSGAEVSHRFTILEEG